MTERRKSASRKIASAKTAPTIITLSASRDIALDRLVLAQTNVRRLKTGLSIEELAEDIAQRTLLQSLSVRPILDDAGAETGRYEIPAGGRRFRALQLLVQQKRLAANAPIPCIVRTEGLAEEDSLAENVQRIALHPLDQYRAFVALREQGLGEEAIAARFFVTPLIVRQRLKLAAASPRLLDLYAADELSLEQLMAFCVCDDHARQEQTWEAIQRGWNKEPHLIRRLLTEDSVAAGDRRAVFVGIDAYEAAGGHVLRDLFQQDRGGWLEDVALLDRLALAKMEAEARAIRAEGWAWVTVGLDFPYGHTHGLRRISGEDQTLTEAEQASLDALQAEREALLKAHEAAEELPGSVEARVDELDAAIAAIEERPPVYDPAEITSAGAFVSIGHDGALYVERGYVRPDDATPDADASGRGSRTEEKDAARSVPGSRAGATLLANEEAEDELRPLPERLVTELTAFRTLALRDALAEAPDTAFLAVLHRLCLSLFQHHGDGSCLEIQTISRGFGIQAPDLARTAPAKAIEARHAGWAQRLPHEPAALWTFLHDLDADSRMALFAHCASLTLDAVQEPGSRRTQAMADADRLAGAVGLDLVGSGWEPTVANYLGRVTKGRILEAVREARSEAAVQLIDHLRKADMAREAERLLTGTGWLPEPLRDPGGETAGVRETGDMQTANAAEPLPAFLMADDHDEAEDDADGGVERDFDRNLTAVLAA